jgi:hypothetical protein
MTRCRNARYAKPGLPDLYDLHARLVPLELPFEHLVLECAFYHLSAGEPRKHAITEPGSERWPWTALPAVIMLCSWPVHCSCSLRRS